MFNLLASPLLELVASASGVLIAFAGGWLMGREPARESKSQALLVALRKVDSWDGFLTREIKPALNDGEIDDREWESLLRGFDRLALEASASIPNQEEVIEYRLRTEHEKKLLISEIISGLEKISEKSSRGE